MKRNLKTRGLIFLLTFLLLAAVCSPALLTTAAAEGSVSIKSPDPSEYLPNAGPGGGDDTSGAVSGGETDEDGGIVDGILDGIEDFFGGMFEGIGKFFGDAFDGIGDMLVGIGDALSDIGTFFHDVLNWVLDLPNAIDRFVKDQSKDEFNNFLQEDWTGVYQRSLLGVVNRVYEVLYPFGVFVMLIAWALSVGASGFTMTLDPTNKTSILRAILQLLVGMVLLTATPQLLMLIFSLCHGIKALIVGEVQATSGHSFILFIFELKVYLNLARVAVLQCVSPLFVGSTSGNEGVRRFAVNFFKEYLLCCMELVLVTVYILIVDRLEAYFSGYSLIYGILASIVLSISVFTIEKRFEKLFH